MTDFVTDARLVELESKVADLRRERDCARQALRDARSDLAAATKQLGLVEQITSLDPRPPKWLTPKPKSGNRATVCALLSDCHLDEVVDPAEVAGVNAFDRDIAELRLRRFFQRVVVLSRDYLSGVSYDGAVLLLGGDLFSGDIHEELVETNEDTVLGSVLHWLEHLAAGVDLLADAFKRVHVVSVVGNHGRRSRKPRAKLRVRDNFDWLIACLLAREFRSDDRVTFTIPETADARVDVYNTRYLLTHGDQFRGGNGVAGIWSPVSRGHLRKTQRDQAAGQPWDWMAMGHWHQLVWGQGWIVNGSLKGVDEYAWQSNFGVEPAQQAMWFTTPEHGITCQMPVLVADRGAEQW